MVLGFRELGQCAAADVVIGVGVAEIGLQQGQYPPVKVASRSALHGPAVVVGGFAETAEAGAQAGSVKPRIRRVRVKAERLVVLHKGVAELSLVQQGVAEAQKRLNVFRVEFDRLAEGGN